MRESETPTVSLGSEREAAVDDQGLAGDHGGVGAEEDDRGGDVLGPADAAEQRAVDRGALPLLRPRLGPAGIDEAGRDGVDPRLRRQRACEFFVRLISAALLAP